MSIEEQVDEIAKLICSYPQCMNYNKIGGCKVEVCRIADAAENVYNQGYRKQKWISVDERLPVRPGKYLVATFDGKIGFGNLVDYYCDGNLSFDNYKVTHWMPLPEAPKMKGGAE